MVLDCVNSCDIDLRKDLYSNIIFSGGNTLMGGLIEKVQKKVVEGNSHFTIGAP
jgi:actin-like protein 6A